MRFLYEIKKRCGIVYELPESESDPIKLLEELEALLGLVANKFSSGQKRSSKKLVLVIDGLHVVDQKAATSLLSIFPHSFPSCVRAIFSTQTNTLSYDISLISYLSLVLLPSSLPLPFFYICFVL